MVFKQHISPFIFGTYQCKTDQQVQLLIVYLLIIKVKHTEDKTLLIYIVAIGLHFLESSSTISSI
ncbi:hypothetical protein M23134_00245 [Microscilla marina ATCC 23134]|uniref:Uncharacterized protein n=1 Tax=Microscilla marina ATCC 23134 TaxID=313606 RepID=A1ZP12_MICM2|nr:hypothetical protein M23134_00245 [Microscilla marina ATCC 23134]